MILEGKVAVVTGGAFGIGRAFCHAMAGEGARVVIADLDCARAEIVAGDIRKDGHVALAVETDVSDQHSTLRLARQTMESFGKVDILVNNAAYMIGLGPPKPWDQIEVSEWDSVMSVNLRGVFLCSQAIVPHMVARGKGKVINITSAAAFGGFPGRIHYATSKAGIVAFTKTLARELAGKNINVTAIAPGFVLSERVMAGDYLPGEQLSQASERSIDSRCIRKDMYPRDLIGTLLFLASDASEFVCGETIVVDGGSVMR